MQIYSNIFSTYTLIFSFPTRPTILQNGVFCRMKSPKASKCKNFLFPTTSYNPTAFPTKPQNYKNTHNILIIRYIDNNNSLKRNAFVGL